MALLAGAVAFTIGVAPASADTASWRSVAPEGLSDAILDDVSTEQGVTWTAGLDVSDRSPLALRWNGTGWTRTPQPAAHGRVNDIAAAPGGEAWAVGYKEEGTKQEGTQQDTPTVQHWDGASWKFEDLPLPAVAVAGFYAVAVSPRGTVWVGGGLSSDDPGGDPLLMTRSPQGEWRNTEIPADAAVGSTISVLPLAEDDVWLVGAKGVTHFDGTTWTRQRLPAHLDGQAFSLGAIAQRKPGEIWAVGLVEDDKLWRRPVVLRLYHGRWEEVPTPKETAQLQGITFDEQDRPVIVGETFDPAVDPDFTYVLTMDRAGHLVRGQQPPGSGRLYGTDIDEQGRIWVSGTNDDPSGLHVPYVAVRD